MISQLAGLLYLIIGIVAGVAASENEDEEEKEGKFDFCYQ
jgi:hypothetical protein